MADDIKPQINNFISRSHLINMGRFEGVHEIHTVFQGVNPNGVIIPLPNPVNIGIKEDIVEGLINQVLNQVMVDKNHLTIIGNNPPQAGMQIHNLNIPVEQRRNLLNIINLPNQVFDFNNNHHQIPLYGLPRGHNNLPV